MFNMKAQNKLVYSIELPAASKPVTFVNGIIARNVKGMLWLMLFLLCWRYQVEPQHNKIKMGGGPTNLLVDIGQDQI